MVMRLGLTALLATACLDTQQVLFPGVPDASVPDAGAPDAGAPAGLFASSLAAGDYHACAISQGALWCWGANANGELGTVDLGDRSQARRVDANTDWTTAAAGDSSTCGLRGAGEVWCWGKNGNGEVGRGDFQVQVTPRRVTLALPAQQLVVYGHTCVVLSDASLWCWGVNSEGQLGQNDGFGAPNATAPLQVAPGTTWRAVSNGQGHMCGVQTDGSLWCWGRNTNHHLGLGVVNPGQVRAPMHVGTDTDWRSLSCHQEGCCALKADRTLWCWGASHEAGLGVRSDGVPTQVGTDSDWVSIEAETFFACGLKASGALWCWGRNLEGELGTGDYADRFMTGEVGDGGVQQVVVGRFSRCVRAADGRVRCNGSNEHGQLGTADFNGHPDPTDVQLDE